MASAVRARPEPDPSVSPLSPYISRISLPAMGASRTPSPSFFLLAASMRATATRESELVPRLLSNDLGADLLHLRRPWTRGLILTGAWTEQKGAGSLHGSGVSDLCYSMWLKGNNYFDDQGRLQGTLLLPRMDTLALAGITTNHDVQVIIGATTGPLAVRGVAVSG